MEALRAIEIKHAKQKKAAQAALDKAEASRKELEELVQRIQAEDENAADQRDILEALDGQLEKDKKAVAGEGARLGSAQVDAMAESLAEMQQTSAMALAVGTTANSEPSVRAAFEKLVLCCHRHQKLIPPELRMPHGKGDGKGGAAAASSGATAGAEEGREEAERRQR